MFTHGRKVDLIVLFWPFRLCWFLALANWPARASIGDCGRRNLQLKEAAIAWMDGLKVKLEAIAPEGMNKADSGSEQSK